MNAWVPPSESPYAHGAGAAPAGLPWYRVLVRVVLVVVPGQIVGALLATILIVPVDVRAHPHATALFWVLPGLVAGVALALLLLRPDVRQPWSLLGVGAAVAAVSILALVLLGQARVPDAALAGAVLALLGGLVGCVAIQSVVAAGLWALRRRSRAQS